MRPLRAISRLSPYGEQGMTMIELLVAISMGIVVSLAAFSFLGFASSDVSRINERVRVQQAARTSLENIVLQLHSACVTPAVTPILVKSSGTKLMFISEAGTAAFLPTVQEHELLYEPAKGKTKGTLVENTYLSTSEGPNYSFSTKASSTKRLLTGITESETGGKTVPIFQYYRYYGPSDTIPTGHTTIPYGELYPTPLTSTELGSATSIAKVVKVTVGFTLAPENTEAATFHRDRPVPLEDSVVFRLAPAGESSQNLPCSSAK